MSGEAQQRRAVQVRRLVEMSLMFVIVLLLALSLAGSLAHSAGASIRCATSSLQGELEDCGHAADADPAPRAAARITFSG